MFYADFRRFPMNSAVDCNEPDAALYIPQSDKLASCRIFITNWKTVPERMTLYKKVSLATRVPGDTTQFL